MKEFRRRSLAMRNTKKGDPTNLGTNRRPTQDTENVADSQGQPHIAATSFVPMLAIIQSTITVEMICEIEEKNTFL